MLNISSGLIEHYYTGFELRAIRKSYGVSEEDMADFLDMTIVKYLKIEEKNQKINKEDSDIIQYLTNAINAIVALIEVKYMEMGTNSILEAGYNNMKSMPMIFVPYYLENEKSYAVRDFNSLCYEIGDVANPMDDIFSENMKKDLVNYAYNTAGHLISIKNKGSFMPVLFKTDEYIEFLKKYNYNFSGIDAKLIFCSHSHFKRYNQKEKIKIQEELNEIGEHWQEMLDQENQEKIVVDVEGYEFEIKRAGKSIHVDVTDYPENVSDEDINVERDKFFSLLQKLEDEGGIDNVFDFFKQKKAPPGKMKNENLVHFSAPYVAELVSRGLIVAKINNKLSSPTSIQFDEIITLKFERNS